MTPPTPTIESGESSLVSFFSPDYFEARHRFIDACLSHGLRHFALPLGAPSPTDQPLSIDAAVVGSEAPRRALVVSSGVHGVETPLGSAVQLAFLKRLLPNMTLPPDVAVVLIHAVNPFGYAWRRRFNEENVDLNRNFLLTGERYEGAPSLAHPFRRVLGPQSRPARFWGSNLRMGYLAARHGTRAFWDTLPVGQYEIGDWLFYGGQRLSQSGELLREHLPEWIGTATEAIHLDFHTGLGRWGRLELLLSENETNEEVGWWRQHFRRHPVVESRHENRYLVRGGFGPWLQSLTPHCRYHYACAEFGTYSARRVIRALADESRWTNFDPELSPDHWSRRRLAEMFAPGNKAWRRETAKVGLHLAQQSYRILVDQPPSAS